MGSGQKTISVRVTPRASKAIVKKEISGEGQEIYKVYVTVVAEDGKANKVVIAQLAEFFGIAKSKISILRGETSRDKIIQIEE